MMMMMMMTMIMIIIMIDDDDDNDDGENNADKNLSKNVDLMISMDFQSRICTPA